MNKDEYKKFIDAAEAWLTLDLPAEAVVELEKIPTSERNSVIYYKIKWEAHARLKQWDEALAIAQEWIKRFPDHPGGWSQRSYVLHELGRTKEAYELLLQVVNSFPKEWVIPYNLACYACRLGKLEEAKQWLELAVKRTSRKFVQELGLEDKDLEPLWPELKAWKE